MVQNEVASAAKLNRDLETIRLWVWQWKMEVNVEKTEEVIFSSKRTKLFHPPRSMDNIGIVRVSEHKHLGMIMDS